MKDVIERVFGAVDWAALGEIYFHEDGEAELMKRRAGIVELGLQLAEQLLRRLTRGGRSLWVGAGVGELPVLIAERLTAGREVVATNLRREECDLLNAALRQADQDLEINAVDARDVVAPGSFDHVGCISLFTDPETWPLLSDVTYGRIAPVQLDLERFGQEREQARAMAGALFGALQRPGWITTSADEVAWFLEHADAAGVGYEAGDELVATAVVGDPVGFLRIT